MDTSSGRFSAEPFLGLGCIDDTGEANSIPGRIFQRLVPEPGGGIRDQLVQPLVARPRLKGIGNPDAGPILRGKMQDALRIGLAKPWRRIKLECKGIVGRMARRRGSSRASRVRCLGGHLSLSHVMAAGQQLPKNQRPLTVR